VIGKTLGPDQIVAKRAERALTLKTHHDWSTIQGMRIDRQGHLQRVRQLHHARVDAEADNEHFDGRTTE
jgi:hypothetical protein